MSALLTYSPRKNIPPAVAVRRFRKLFGSSSSSLFCQKVKRRVERRKLFSDVEIEAKCRYFLRRWNLFRNSIDSLYEAAIMSKNICLRSSSNKLGRICYHFIFFRTEMLIILRPKVNKSCFGRICFLIFIVDRKTFLAFCTKDKFSVQKMARSLFKVLGIVFWFDFFD